MPVVKLDASTVLTAHCEPGRRKVDYYDDGTTAKGFVLEVRATGGKTFYLRYLDQQGRQKQHKIGAYGDITLDQAKRVAKRLRSEVVLGGNPAADKEARRAVPTYAELSKKHLAFIKTQVRSYDTIEGYARRHILPRWGKKLVSDIHQPDIAAWLAEKKQSGLAIATVEKIRVIMSRSFELGLKWSIPGIDRNPVRGISLGPINNARDRTLSPDELVRLHQAVRNSRNPLLAPIVGMLFATGARISELLASEWSDVNLEQRTLHIRTSKNGRGRYCPLNTSAIEIIEALPRRAGAKFLFENPNTRRPITTIKHSWDTARKEAGLADFRIHDIRHCTASRMASAQVDLYTIGKVLGHLNHASTQRYAHHSQAALLAAVEAGSEKLGSWTA